MDDRNQSHHHHHHRSGSGGKGGHQTIIGNIKKWIKFGMSRKGLLYCSLMMAIIEVLYSFHTAVKYVSNLPNEQQNQKIPNLKSHLVSTRRS